MIQYHYFKTKDEADAWLADHRAKGGLGYAVGRLGYGEAREYEVRELV